MTFWQPPSSKETEPLRVGYFKSLKLQTGPSLFRTILPTTGPHDNQHTQSPASSWQMQKDLRGFANQPESSPKPILLLVLPWPNDHIILTRLISFYDQIPFLSPSYKCPSCSLSILMDTHRLRPGLALTCLSLSCTSPPGTHWHLPDTNPLNFLLQLSCACQEGHL